MTTICKQVPLGRGFAPCSWYRKYSDGWIEQGGIVSGTATHRAPKVTTTFPVAFSTTPTIVTVEVFPSEDTNRSGRLGLSHTVEGPGGENDYRTAYAGIEASSTGMSIRITTNDFYDSVAATVYYVVCGK